MHTERASRVAASALMEVTMDVFTGAYQAGFVLAKPPFSGTGDGVAHVSIEELPPRIGGGAHLHTKSFVVPRHI